MPEIGVNPARLWLFAAAVIAALLTIFNPEPAAADVPAGVTWTAFVNGAEVRARGNTTNPLQGNGSASLTVRVRTWEPGP